MAASEFNVIDQLAQAYEAEDSQTMIDRGSDHEEDTVVFDPKDIDETVIHNNDHYIDRHAYSEESTTVATSPAFSTKISSRSLVGHTGKVGAVTSKSSKAPQYTQQPSRDFLIMVENLQKELSTKNKALQVLADNLKTSRKENEQLTQALERSKEAHTQQQIALLQKEQKIDEQKDAIQELQSKLDPQNHKNNNQDDVDDDEKQQNGMSKEQRLQKDEDDGGNGNGLENETTALLIKSGKKSDKSVASEDDKIESEIAAAQNDGCCIVLPWFRR